MNRGELGALAPPKRRWSRVGVVVIRNIAHVIVEVPLARAELLVGDEGKLFVQCRLDGVARCGVVDTPNDHRHHADRAVGDPTVFVVVVARRDDRRFTERTGTQLTLSETDECHATSVPAAGTSESTLVHFVVPAPGPCVVK